MKYTHKPWLTGLRTWSCVALGALLLSVVPAQGQKIFFEDFEGLTLGPNVDEALPGDAVYSPIPPAGWTVDHVSKDGQTPLYGIDPIDPNNGVTEFRGWTFLDRDWWAATAGDQRRTEFVRARGTVAVADPDEWDDKGDPESLGTFNSKLITPAISVSGAAAGSLYLTFDSSTRTEEPQEIYLTVAFDGGAETELLRWTSDPGPTLKQDAPDETIVLALNNPAGASNVEVTFGLEKAKNDWWWAVDNIAVGVPPFATGISGNGYAFTVRLVEATGRTVNQNTLVVELDGTPVTPLTTAAEANGIEVTYDRFPQVFEPGKTYVVTTRFTSSDGRQIVDTLNWTAPSFTTVTSTPTGVTAVITDTDYGLTVNENAGIQLSLDGTTVTPTSVSRNGDQLTIVYSQAPTIFASGSSHNLAVTFQTMEAVSVTDTVSFTAPVWASISPALATAPGTGTEAGLRWRTHQLANARGTTIAEAEAQLAGTLGPSIHDPNAHTPAQGADGYFRIDWVNYEQAAGTAGRFNSGAAAPLNVPDDYIPGAVGTDPDNLAGEARAFLDLPAGFYTMVVNSDDGFQVTVGTTNNPTYQVLGRFDGGRGASDSLFYFNIEQAGVYFFRLLWFEGGGGASVEWLTVNNGAAALVNGEQPGAVRAYRTRNVPEPDLPVETDLRDGLVAYWNFDGNFFDSIKDFHGTGRGSVPIDFVDGKPGFGKAIKLNGENQFVEITGGDENELEFPGGSMSIAGWFRVDAFDTEWQALIAKGEGTNYRVARRAATGTIAYAGGVGEGADDVPAVNDGEWHHFVAVSDASGAEFGTAIYVDGVRRGVNATLPILDQNDFNLMIGENPGARNREWEGEIDDIAIWNRVLSADEVAQLYNNGAGTALSTLTESRITGLGLNFGGNQTDSTLAAGEVAGVPGAAQANWNTLNGETGSSNALVGNAGGTAEPVTTTVEWVSNNTWASTGAGEENNGFTGPDKVLMTGYLDTDANTTSTVTISGIPESLVNSQYGYDVYVYTLGGVPARGGSYRVVNPATDAVIRGYVKAQSPANPTSYTMVPTTDPEAWGEGTYVLFRGLTANSIRIEGTTVDPWGIGEPNRAPINAVQLVPALEAGPDSGVEFTSIVVNTDGTITVTWTGEGVLEAAETLDGPWAPITGATSPYTFPVEQQSLFGRIRVP